MTSHHYPSDHEPLGSVDSVGADHPPPPPARWQHDDSSAPRIRLMCSFGGRILPRPHDNQLRYVGGDTRIVAVHRNCTVSTLLSKLAKFTTTADITIKYQLPNEDLDALISVTTDEDVDNMLEEYDRLLAQGSSTNSRTARLRLFLIPSDPGGGFGSMLSGTGSSKHEDWFLDALNGRSLERGRSEASSIVSEMRDYLFGLDNNSDEPMKLKTNVSVSDPDSPAPVISSPQYGSTSSVQSVPAIPNTAAVEIKREIVDTPVEPELNQQRQGGYVPHPVWQYVTEPVPGYYVPVAVQGGNVPVRPFPMPMPMPMPSYVQPVQQMARGPIPEGYRPVYVGAPPAGRPAMAGAYEYPSGPTAVGVETYEVPAGVGLTRNNPGVVPMYRPTMGVPPGAGESPAMSSNMRIPRSSQ